MISLLKGFVALAINPFNSLVVLLVACGFFLWLKNWRWLKISTVTFVAIFALMGSYPFPNLLIGHLEKQYVPLSIDGMTRERPYDILVLGSGHVADPDLNALAQLSRVALGRIVEGVRLHVQLPNSRLIVSGYGRRSKTTQARLLAEAAISLGVEAADIDVFEDPSTTEEEAIYYQQSKSGRQLILVTSASHMPRAMQIFKNRGVDPIAAPAYFRVKIDPDLGFNWRLFAPDNFRNVQLALHEYVGMAWERWRG